MTSWRGLRRLHEPSRAQPTFLMATANDESVNAQSGYSKAPRCSHVASTTVGV